MGTIAAMIKRVAFMLPFAFTKLFGLGTDCPVRRGFRPQSF
jgi:hypothetical protein